MVADASAARGGRAAPPASRAARPAVRRVAGHGSAEGEVDQLIHHRLRLGILSALAATESLSFNELKALLRTTDGNLSVHARKLEDASYLTCTKSFEGRRPRTAYRLAAKGRLALERYLDHMEALIRATRDTLGH
jgi:DNA-binding MarR family transcriptional regulator